MNFDVSRLKDPLFFAENRVAAHSDHVAYASMEELSHGETSLRCSLNGLWKFHHALNADQVIPYGQELNDLVIAGRLEPDQEKRVEIYTQLVNYINEEAISMPLYQDVNTALYRSDLKGVTADQAVPVNRFFYYTYCAG